MGSPCSFKLVMKCFDPKTTHPVLFESAIICATVALMCPAMSFIASFLYYPYYEGFNFIHLLANWLKLVCFNFPTAYIFTQFDSVTETVWWTFPIAETLTAVIAVFILKNSYKQRIPSIPTLQTSKTEKELTINN